MIPELAMKVSKKAFWFSTIILVLLTINYFTNFVSYVPSDSEERAPTLALQGDISDFLTKALHSGSFELVNDKIQNPTKDYWGIEHKVTFIEDKLEVRSAGIDHIFNTKDDYVEFVYVPEKAIPKIHGK